MVPLRDDRRRRPHRLTSLALAGTVLLGLTVPASAQELPSAEQIAATARARWQERPRPALVEYDVDVQGHHKRDSYERIMHVRFDVVHRSATVRVASATGSAPFGTDPQRQRMSPADSFGFADPVRRPSIARAPDALPQIGTVTVARPLPYEITRAGMEPVGEAMAYHLLLRPKADPDRYKIRELWIDTQTYEVRRLVARLSDGIGPFAVHYDMTAEYGAEGPYWLMHSANAAGAVHLGVFTYSGDGTARFDHYTFPQS